MIYKNGGISIDRHFVRIDSKSYAIDKINSVDVRSEIKTGCLWMIIAFIAMICLFSAIGSGTIGGWITFLFFAGITVIAFIKRPRRKFILILATSSGEVQALTDFDEVNIVKLRTGIEQAMTMSKESD